MTFELDKNMLPKQPLDFNKINQITYQLMEKKRFSDAIKVLVCLCDGDDYFEAGTYAFKISTCYEKLGDNFMAKYWAGVAVVQNPSIYSYVEQRNKFQDVNILDLVELSEII